MPSSLPTTASRAAGGFNRRRRLDRLHPEIARRYVERHPDIFRLIQKENGGHWFGGERRYSKRDRQILPHCGRDDWVDTDNLVRFIELLRETDTDLVVDQKTKVDISTGEPTFVKLPSKIIFNHRYDFLNVSDDEVCHFYALHTLSARLDILKENNIRPLERAFLCGQRIPA